MNIRCDIFCTVIDNLGDAGVCWRLARQLVREHGWVVRLWIDDPAPLAGLRPGVDPALARQQRGGVEIVRWEHAFSDVTPGNVVIEAFACDLPENFVTAMAQQAQRPVWINLEYLSAEPWVESHHGLSSPHPRLPLIKYFFFPGFTPRTGGLLRERATDFAHPDSHGAPSVSLFCYDNPALPRLLDAWAAGAEPLRCLVAAGLPARQVAAWAGTSFAVGDEIERGGLRLVATPFVSQDEFDRRLAACDLNFVRGEDSFVRAQWAKRPFVWQIYPQTDDAHRIKLDAFLDRYAAGLAPMPADALRHFWQAWNSNGDVAACWPALRATLPALARHAAAWEEHLRALGDLADNLVRFCEARL